MRRSLPLVVALEVGRAAGAQQSAAPSVTIGTGVDTTARANHDVFALWRDYLRDRPDSARANAYWASDERARWASPDLTASWVAPPGAWPSGLTATVVDLGPEVPGDTSTFVVRTLFTRGGVPVALTRVYAVRDASARDAGVRDSTRWALANALPRLTRDWPRLRAGRVEFVYGTGRTADTARATRAARFVDSAIAAMGVRPPERIAYYLVQSPREMARVLGLDLGITTNSGRVYPENALMVAGAPGTTEWNTHDLAHLVIGAMAGPTGRWWSEGAAAWIGGRGGRDFPRLLRELDADLARNPTRTLDSIVAPHAWRDSVSATAAAVLVRLAFQRGGIRAVHALVGSPADTPEDVRRAAAQVLGVRPEDVEGVWRRAIRGP